MIDYWNCYPSKSTTNCDKWTMSMLLLIGLWPFHGCLIDQYERKSSWQIYKKGAGDNYNNLNKIYKCMRRDWVKKYFPPHTSRTNPMKRRVGGRAGYIQYIWVSKYTCASMFPGTSPYYNMCGKRSTRSQIWSLNRPRDNDVITASWAALQRRRLRRHPGWFTENLHILEKYSNWLNL